MTLALESCKANGFIPDVTVTGGGSDANFINAYGVPCVILGTGMSEVHTVVNLYWKKIFITVC